jgi:dienelactone hydrolase
MNKLLSALVVGGVVVGGARAAVTTREVNYPAGNVTARGLLALPGGEGTHPAVLVVHEWWGVNDYARKRARMLAELGYVALAVDLYGDGKTAEHPEDAGAFATAVMSDLPEATNRFEAAMKFLADQPEVDAAKIAAIGYCFGGGVVLQMAATGVDGLDAVVSFHGSLGAEVPAGTTPTAPMLVLTGTADEFVPDEQVKAFEERMQDAGAEVTVIEYPGAKHGFTNPEADAKAAEFGIPIGYDLHADEASWGEMREFLSGAFATAG